MQIPLSLFLIYVDGPLSHLFQMKLVNICIGWSCLVPLDFFSQGKYVSSYRENGFGYVLGSFYLMGE